MPTLPFPRRLAVEVVRKVGTIRTFSRHFGGKAARGRQGDRWAARLPLGGKVTVGRQGDRWTPRWAWAAKPAPMTPGRRAPAASPRATRASRMVRW